MITILGYSMALAADVHNDQMPQLSHYMDNHDGGHHSGHPEQDNDTAHDHCYHGNSHLLGLNINSDIDFSMDQSSLHFFYSDTIISIPPSRFLRPPRSA